MIIIKNSRYILHGLIDSKFDPNNIQSNFGLIRRSQTVLIDNNVLSTLDLIAGVPQESILGPLLYLNCYVQNYADDKQVYLSFIPERLVESIQNITDDLGRLKHSLFLNPSKPLAMKLKK